MRHNIVCPVFWDTVYSFWNIEHGNENLDWNEFQMFFKVIKSGTNRKLVVDFLLIVYSNFCHITRRLREIWCETNDLEILARSLTVILPEICCVISYLSNFSFFFNFRRIGCGNENCRLTLPWKVIQGHQTYPSKARIWVAISVLQ